MGYIRLETACGIPLVVDHNKNEPGIAFGILVKVGTADEILTEPNFPYGIAHAFEHMVFEKTEMFDSIEALAGHLENIGGEIGAGTTNSLTFYWTLVPKRSFRRAVQALHQMISKPIFEKSGIEREIQVILQELREYHDDPTAHIDDLFMETLFEGHPLGNTILGEEASVLSLTPRDFERFYRRFYHPQNLTFVAAGGINPRLARNVIDENFANWKTTEDLIKTGPFPDPPYPINKVRTIKKTAIKNAYAIIGGAFPEAHERNGIIAEIFAIMLDGTSRIETNSGKGFSFPLSLELRGEGLSYSLAAESVSFRNVGQFYVKMNPEPGRLEEALGLVRRLIEEKKNDAKLLSRAKKAATQYNNLNSSSLKDDIEIAADEIDVYGEPLPIERRNAEIRSVKIREVREFVDRFLNPERLVTVAIVPN